MNHCVLWKSLRPCLVSLNSFGKHESVAMFSPEDFELLRLVWAKCLNRDNRRLPEVTDLTSFLSLFPYPPHRHIVRLQRTVYLSSLKTFGFLYLNVQTVSPPSSCLPRLFLSNIKIYFVHIMCIYAYVTKQRRDVYA